jgi:hypothetical protein
MNEDRTRMKVRRGSAWSLVRRDAATVTGAVAGLIGLVAALGLAVGIGQWLAAPSAPEAISRDPIPSVGSFESPPISSAPIRERPSQEPVAEPATEPDSQPQGDPGPSDSTPPKGKGSTGSGDGDGTTDPSDPVDPVDPVDPTDPTEDEFDAARFIQEATEDVGRQAPAPVGGLVSDLGKTTAGVVRGAGQLFGGLVGGLLGN